MSATRKRFYCAWCKEEVEVSFMEVSLSLHYHSECIEAAKQWLQETGSDHVKMGVMMRGQPYKKEGA